MILFCTCVHTGQDKLHGPQRRCFNMKKPVPYNQRHSQMYRCTVCEKEKTRS